MARRHAPGACPNERIETPAMGRDDGDTDLLFWETNEETDVERLQLAVDLEPTSICEFRASPNPVLRLQTIKAIVDSHSFKVQNQMSLEECRSWTCIVLLGLRVKVQVKGLSIKD